VTVHIDDVNDNRPRFSEPIVTLSISESARPGSRYVIPAASDADSPQFAVQRYELDSRTNKFSLEVSQNIDGTQEVHVSCDHTQGCTWCHGWGKLFLHVTSLKAELPILATQKKQLVPNAELTYNAELQKCVGYIGRVLYCILCAKYLIGAVFVGICTY